MSDKDELRDNIKTRGQRGSNVPGTVLFVGLRLADGFVLQRALQVINPLTLLSQKLGLAPPIPGPAGGPVLSMSDHDLTPFQAVIWAASIGSAMKQCFWLLYIANEPMPPSTAIPVAIFNSIANSLNTLLFSAASSNPTWFPSLVPLGATIYVVGILIETISELQRKAFKDQPENAGKPYSGGLWSYARHINYLGYTMWRSGAALAAGGIWGGLTFAFFTYDFCARGIPVLDRYCESRYGQQWRKIRANVPYKFIPGVY